MEIDITQKRILSTALNLPVFGFYHGMLMAFPNYFMARDRQFSELILNRRPKAKPTKYCRYVDKIKPLVRSNYLQVIMNSTPGSIFGEKRTGVNTVFKATDKAWRALGNNGDSPSRRRHNFDITCTTHDMKTAAVLLAFRYGMGFELRRPLDWRNSHGHRAPLPDGVIVSKTGTEIPIEFERIGDKRNLEKHIRSYGNTHVILIHENLANEVTALTLELLKKHGLSEWRFTFFKPLMQSSGRGPYYNLDAEEFYKQSDSALPSINFSF